MENIVENENLKLEELLKRFSNLVLEKQEKQTKVDELFAHSETEAAAEPEADAKDDAAAAGTVKNETAVEADEDDEPLINDDQLAHLLVGAVGGVALVGGGLLLCKFFRALAK